MRKAVPEVRMTEAARKRSAKIRANKETAENKPGSPRFQPRTRVKPLTTRSDTLEKKPTGSSMTNLEPKKAKIDESTIKRRTTREPLKTSTSINQRANQMSMRHPSSQVVVKKMSSITAAKVKEREEKQLMKNNISRLEEEKEVLIARVRHLEEKLSKSDVIATVILPNLVVKHDALVQEQQRQQELVAEQLTQITTHYTQKVLMLENRISEYQQNQSHLEHQINTLNNQLMDQINATNAQRALNAQQVATINERDEIITGFEQQLEEVTKENDARIEQQVQVRIQPWVEAKAQAESMQIEVEFKNEKNRKLQAQLNQAQQSIEKLNDERTQLLVIAQQSEEKDAMLENLSTENRRLNGELELSRVALTAREAEVQDLSFNLEEEKYRVSVGEKPQNSSFRAIYDEKTSHSPTDKSLSDRHFFVQSTNTSEVSSSDDVFEKS